MNFAEISKENERLRQALRDCEPLHSLTLRRQHIEEALRPAPQLTRAESIELLTQFGVWVEPSLP